MVTAQPFSHLYLLTITVVALWSAAWPGFAAAQNADKEEVVPCQTEYALLRYEDQVRCPDALPESDLPFPPLKNIALASGHLDLSLGGEITERWEKSWSPEFAEQPGDPDGTWLQRLTFHADLKFDHNIRAFVQLISAVEAGRAGPPSPVDRNDLALQNAFVEFSVPTATETRAMLRIGRQELRYGSARLIDVREGTNVRRTFDAALIRLSNERFRIDGFVARPIQVSPGAFDDHPNDDITLGGIYATRRPSGRRLGLDIYWLYYRQDTATFGQTTGDERRYSLGTRLFGRTAEWDYNIEAIAQFGTFADQRITAWTLASEIGRSFPALPLAPRIALSANIASGDSDPRDDRLEAFNALFPRGNYFSEITILGPRNFYNLHPFLVLHPSPRLTVTADANFFWRLETADGVYRPNGSLLRGPGGSQARYVGTTVSIEAAYSPSPALELVLTYSHLDPGRFIVETGPSEPIDFVSIEAKWRF